MKRAFRMRGGGALLLALLAGSIAPSVAVAQGGGGPKTTNGTVSFKVHCDAGVIDQEIRACLTVEKPGEKPLVNGNPTADQVDGNHNFPAGSTAEGAAAYYKGLLTNAGWTEGTDFRVDGGTISFYGISKLDGGTTHQHLVLNGTTDSTDVPWEDLKLPKPEDSEEPKKKKASVTRGAVGSAGTIALTGFGLNLHENGILSSSTSHVTARFFAQDSAPQILARVLDALLAAGWDAGMNAEGELVIRRNGHGEPVYSLLHSIQYFADPDGETGDGDHWVFTLD